MAWVAVSANGKYRFDTVVCGRTIREWVAVVDNCFVQANNWEPRHLLAGSFAFDVLAASVCAVLGAYITGERDRVTLASGVHAAWAKIFIWWRDNPPPYPYCTPREPLTDARRNTLAGLPFAALVKHEQNETYLVVDAVLEKINNPV